MASVFGGLWPPLLEAFPPRLTPCAMPLLRAPLSSVSLAEGRGGQGRASCGRDSVPSLHHPVRRCQHLLIAMAGLSPQATWQSAQAASFFLLRASSSLPPLSISSNALFHRTSRTRRSYESIRSGRQPSAPRKWQLSLISSIAAVMLPPFPPFQSFTDTRLAAEDRLYVKLVL